MQFDRKVNGEHNVDDKVTANQDILAFDPQSGAVIDFPSGSEFLKYNEGCRLRNERPLIRVQRYARAKCPNCLGRGALKVLGKKLFAPCGCLRPVFFRRSK